MALVNLKRKTQLLLLILTSCPALVCAQTLQLHFDPRHTLDPKHNHQNFPTIYFEFFKSMDTLGSFFIKTEDDLQGANHNAGKFYTQVSRSFKLWHPKIYAQLQYSGGMGIAEPGSYGYYITNAFSLGAVYPFQWKGGWFSTSLSYAYNAFKRPSNDLLYSLYWGRGFWNYKFEFSGDINLYTLNRNLGDAHTAGLKGKQVSFFGEPQIWFKIHNGFALGSKINMYYHVLIADNLLQVYPTIAARFKFN
ncbi:MAG TPA: DUF5020 family protein [Mucilaginibacter sp.]|nr:DUF5020 family protein [Mucilaginibacter sp.]